MTNKTFNRLSLIGIALFFTGIGLELFGYHELKEYPIFAAMVAFIPFLTLAVLGITATIILGVIELWQGE